MVFRCSIFNNGCHFKGGTLLAVLLYCIILKNEKYIEIFPSWFVRWEKAWGNNKNTFVTGSWKPILGTSKPLRKINSNKVFQISMKQLFFSQEIQKTDQCAQKVLVVFQMVRDVATYKLFVQHSTRLSNRLHSFDPASHLRFINICNFRTLDHFRRSWQATVVPLWDSVPADLLLQGDCVGWRLVLKDIQRSIVI